MEERYGVRNLVDFFTKRLTMTGFVVGDKDFGPAYAKEHQETVQAWIADGSFPAKLHITRGLENARRPSWDSSRARTSARPC